MVFERYGRLHRIHCATVGETVEPYPRFWIGRSVSREAHPSEPLFDRSESTPQLDERAVDVRDVVRSPRVQDKSTCGKDCGPGPVSP